MIWFCPVHDASVEFLLWWREIGGGQLSCFFQGALCHLELALEREVRDLTWKFWFNGTFWVFPRFEDTSFFYFSSLFFHPFSIQRQRNLSGSSSDDNFDLKFLTVECKSMMKLNIMRNLRDVRLAHNKFQFVIFIRCLLYSISMKIWILNLWGLNLKKIWMNQRMF